jgi:YjbE family integral membrane protein
MTIEYLARVVQIVVIDLALAGDNALVIALAVRTLPKRQQLVGRLWGTAGAVGMRIAFIAVATYLLTLPLLQIIGGVLLLWIAIKLVRQADESADQKSRAGTTLPEAVWIIVVADVVMSLDNVIAVAGAAGGDLILVICGIGLSIPIVILASGILATLMNRFGWLILIAGGVLGDVAGKMLLHDQFVVRRVGDVPGWVEALVRVALALGVIGVGWLAARRHRVGRTEPITS